MVEIKGFKKVDIFLSNGSNSLNRKRRKALDYYFILHKITNPDEYFRDLRLIKNEDEKIKLMDKYIDNVIEYAIFLKDRLSAEQSFKDYLSVIKQFFEEYHIEFYKTDWKRIKKHIPKTGKIVNDLPLDKQKIRLILSNADSLLRAFAFIIMCSGQREEDISNIEISDLHLNEKPPRINNRTKNTGTKKRHPYIYITDECKKAIEDWLSQRDEYTKYRRKISNLPIEYNIKNDNKLFSTSIGRIRAKWNNKLKEVGLDEYILINDKKYYRYRFYNLKSFFRSNLKNRDLAEYLMGHSNINNIYYKKPQNEIQKEYLEYSHNLLLYTNTDYIKESADFRKHLNIIKERTKNAEKEREELRAKIDKFAETIKRVASPNNEETKLFVENAINTFKKMGIPESITKQIEEELPICLNNLRKLSKEEKLNLDYSNPNKVYQKLKPKKKN
jgi:integrase